jgi:hypothetical protein
MIVEIPLSPKPAQTFNILLNDYELTMTFYWRQARVYVDIDVSGEALYRGAICEHAADLVQSPSPLFSGSLRFFDITGMDSPHWTGLGERWVLFYSDEVNEDGDFIFG